MVGAKTLVWWCFLGRSLWEVANFKAEIINKLVEENGIDSVVEFGCGDGKQLSF